MSRRGENIYKRKDGRWEGRYSKGRRADGTIKYGYIYANSYHLVQEQLTLAKEQYQTLRLKNGECTLLFKEWSQQWVLQQRARIKPITYADYVFKLKTYVNPYIGHYALNELSPVIIQQWLYTLKQTGRYASTIRVIFRIVKSCLNQAVKEQKMAALICNNIELPKQQQQKVHALSRQQQKQLEQQAQHENSPYGLAVLFALKTGLRIGEICALKWRDVNLRENQISIQRTLQRVPQCDDQSRVKTKIETSGPKTQKANRVMPISQNVKRLLVSLKKMQVNNRYVFSKRGVAPCEPRLLTYHFHKICRRSGLQLFRFHQLRHTFATRCLEASDNIVAVSALLGHASTQMTLDTYADALLEQRIRVLYKMEKVSRAMTV